MQRTIFVWSILPDVNWLAIRTSQKGISNSTNLRFCISHWKRVQSKRPLTSCMIEFVFGVQDGNGLRLLVCSSQLFSRIDLQWDHFRKPTTVVSRGVGCEVNCIISLRESLRSVFEGVWSRGLLRHNINRVELIWKSKINHTYFNQI